MVSRQLGHASIAITADVYGHSDDVALKEAARRLEDMFDGKTGDDELMFDAMKERRQFNLKRLRDMAQREGLEVRRITFERSIRSQICFAIREGARSVIIHEARTVTQAWEFFRGWGAARQYGHAK